MFLAYNASQYCYHLGLKEKRVENIDWEHAPSFRVLY